jgi:hypothetical protein
MTAPPAATAAPLTPGPVPPPVAGAPAGRPVLVLPVEPAVGAGVAVEVEVPLVAVPVALLVG